MEFPWRQVESAERPDSAAAGVVACLPVARPPSALPFIPPPPTGPELPRVSMGKEGCSPLQGLVLKGKSLSLPFEPLGRPAVFFFDLPSPFTPSRGCTSEEKKRDRQTDGGVKHLSVVYLYSPSFKNVAMSKLQQLMHIHPILANFEGLIIDFIHLQTSLNLRI